MHGEMTRAMVLKRSSTPTARAAGYLGRWSGLFGEMSDDVKELANAVAEELAVEHCNFYGDKSSKAVKGFYLNQLFRSWGTYFPPRMGTAPPRPPQPGAGSQCPTPSGTRRR